VQNLLQFYARLTLFKVKPQDCPASVPLVLFIAYFFISFINAIAIHEFTRAAIHSAVDLGVLLLFMQILLSKRKERIPQTLHAFLGAGIVISIVHTIFSYGLISDRDLLELSQAARLIFFAVFIWVIAVYGHIIRHAADVSLPTGISISLGYIVVNIIVINSITTSLGF